MVFICAFIVLQAQQRGQISIGRASECAFVEIGNEHFKEESKHSRGSIVFWGNCMGAFKVDCEPETNQTKTSTTKDRKRKSKDAMKALKRATKAIVAQKACHSLNKLFNFVPTFKNKTEKKEGKSAILKDLLF